MKKIFALMLAAAMLLSMAACAPAQEAEGPQAAATPEAGQDGDAPTPEAGMDGDGAAPGAEADAPAAGDETVAQALVKDFEEYMAANPDASAQEIADELLQNPAIQFSGASAPVEPGLLMGFGEAEITGFKEGVMFAPMIGTIPFVGYAFILEDGADADAFTSALTGNADPRWNICTEAEETAVKSVGGAVFFVMSPMRFE